MLPGICKTRILTPSLWGDPPGVLALYSGTSPFQGLLASLWEDPRPSSKFIRVCVRAHACMYVCIKVHVCMDVCTFMYVCMHINMCVCVHVCRGLRA